MIKSFLLLSIGVALYAGSGYIFQSGQIEHNLNDLNEIKQIKEIKEIKEDKEDIEKTRYNQNILYSVRLIYSPISTDYSNSIINDSDKSNSIEPRVSASLDKHKLEISYFKIDNEFFSGQNLDTTWYKAAYKYNYKNINIGLAANYISFDGDILKGSDTFPSLEIDFNNNFKFIDLEYGGSLGAGDQIDYSYEYYFNVSTNPLIYSNGSFILGYKNRVVDLKIDNLTSKDHKLEFSGPYIGINAVF